MVGPLYGRALCGRVYVWLDRSFQHPYTIVNVKLSSVDGRRVKYGPPRTVGELNIKGGSTLGFTA